MTCINLTERVAGMVIRQSKIESYVKINLKTWLTNDLVLQMLDHAHKCDLSLVSDPIEFLVCGCSDGKNNA